MVINTNVGALSTMRTLTENTGNLNKALSRLASGSKIVNPADDAAGLAVASKFDAQISRNRGVGNNLTSSLSYSQTQDGFLQKVGKALDRMSELATLALDGTKSTADKTNYNTEFTELKNYISDIGTKDFNGVSLFSGSALAVTKDSDGNTWSLNASSLNAVDVTSVIASGFNVTSSSAVGTIKTAIENVATHRAKVGANIQRLQFTQEQVSILNENLQASVSRIKDVDVAQESTQFARYNILVQSGTAMLAQANMLPQNSLRLLS
ncbi:MAG: flagellin [Limisphaerales bacterium]|nr:MAG: flagellin [Limisphaerales bacterium]|tara:strand:+ start:2384 stop:3181 length:798 start_codon:yes stop_codon:yes gene_type:complete